MIAVVCLRCGEELEEPGGLLFSPPQRDSVVKSHLCAHCYGVTLAEIISARTVTSVDN